MRSLSLHEMIGVWEMGDLRSPVDRALLLLQASAPCDSLQELARLTIGERDRRLLELHDRTLGSRLSCSVECPWCGDELQFELDTQQILEPPATPTTNRLTADLEDLSITFRLPNSNDLVEALACSLIEEGRLQVLTRCLLEIRKGSESLSVEDVPESAIQKICDLMSRADPLADLHFNVQCLSCNKKWQTAFDVISFFWKEIAVRARRALSEVHVLAAAYGWSESEILGMSQARREFYLQAVNA